MLFRIKNYKDLTVLTGQEDFYKDISRYNDGGDGKENGENGENGEKIHCGGLMFEMDEDNPLFEGEDDNDGNYGDNGDNGNEGGDDDASFGHSPSLLSSDMKKLSLSYSTPISAHSAHSTHSAHSAHLTVKRTSSPFGSSPFGKSPKTPQRKPSIPMSFPPPLSLPPSSYSESEYYLSYDKYDESQYGDHYGGHYRGQYLDNVCLPNIEFN